MTPRSWRMLASVLWVFACMPAVADERTDAWDAGRAAYAEGDYAAALAAFLSARELGQEGAAVWYNIGVCQYRLGDYAASRRTFMAMNERYPAMRSLGHYNLGLASMKLDDREQAAGHFRSSYRLGGNDPKLRAMASTMLRRLIEDAGGAPAAAFEWVKALSFRGGYDDNVILRDEEGLAADVSAESPFIEMFGTLRGPYRDGSALKLDAAALIVRYFDADDFDQSTVYVGGLYDWYFADWSAEVGAHVSASTLGGEAFDRSVRLSGTLRYRLDARQSASAGLRLENVSAADDDFSGIEGTRQRLDLSWRWRDAGRQIDLRAVQEANDRDAASVSPDKLRLLASYRYAPDVGWGYSAAAELRASDYGGETPRDEDLRQLDIRVSHYTAEGWELFAELLLADNESTEPAFDYDRMQISVGVFRVF